MTFCRTWNSTVVLVENIDTLPFLTKYFIWSIFFFCILGVGANFFGEILQPQGGSTNGQMAGNGTTPAGKQVVSGDLDASLANLTSNLNLGAGFGK